MPAESKGKLPELRVRVVGDVDRGIYATTTDQRVAGLRVEAKIAGRTPRIALGTAREGMRAVTG